MKSYRVKVAETTIRYFDIEIQINRIEELSAKTNEVLEANGRLKLGFHGPIDGYPVTTFVDLDDWQEVNEKNL